MSPFEASVRALVAAYLNGELDAAELMDALPDPWELHEAADPASTEFVMRSVAALSDFHAGDLPEAELRERLAVLSRSVRAIYGVPSATFTIRTAVSATAAAPSSFGLAAVGRSALTGSVS